jgi:hypothetical protein
VRLNRVEPRFVEFVPENLESGVLYISVAYGAVVHSCLCGCGEKVATPLSPAQWKLTYDGETVSLVPSVGNGALPCRSHYFITRNQVKWAAPLTRVQTAAALQRDRTAVAEHFEVKKTAAKRTSWLRRWTAWFRR